MQALTVIKLLTINITLSASLAGLFFGGSFRNVNQL